MEGTKQLSEQYSPGAVSSRLSSRTGQQVGGVNLTALGAMMEQLAQALFRSVQRRAGAGGSRCGTGPACAAWGKRWQLQLQAQHQKPLHGAASGVRVSLGLPQLATALAEALAAALRLLMTQLNSGQA